KALCRLQKWQGIWGRTLDFEAAPGHSGHGSLERLRKTRDAHDQSVDPQAAAGKDLSRKGAPSWRLSAKAGRLHTRLHDDAEKAEFGVAQGRQGPPHQRFR